MFNNNTLKKKILLVFVAIFLSVSLNTGFLIAQSAIYHGNTESKIFHQASCRYFNCKKCSAEFTSREEAISAGYRPCKVCKP